MHRFVHATEVEGNGRGLACNQAEQQTTDDDPSASHGVQDTIYALTESIYTLHPSIRSRVCPGPPRFPLRPKDPDARIVPSVKKSLIAQGAGMLDGLRDIS